MGNRDFDLTAYTEGYDFQIEKKRKRKRLILLNIMCVSFIITTFVFLILFILSLQTTEQKCNDSYVKSLKKTVELIDYCKENDYDYDRYYREIVGNICSASSMLFISDKTQTRKITMNGLYHLSVKLPNQFRLRMEEIKMALMQIVDEEDQGYALIDKVISESDKQDY